MVTVAEIVLPAGKTYLTVEEIPRWIALALYPEGGKDAEKHVSHLLKSAHPGGAGPEHAEDITPEDEDYIEELGPEDVAYLTRLWDAVPLPPVERCTSVRMWQSYLKAFDAATDRPAWRPIPVWNLPSFNKAILRNDAIERHALELDGAIKAGQVVPRSHAMTPLSIDEGTKPNSRVMVDDLQRYAAKFHIEVRTEPAHAALTSSEEGTAPLNQRERSALDNTIAALLYLLLTPGVSGRPHFPSQSKLIEAILEKYPDTYGLKKRTLEDKFAQARSALPSA